MLAGKTLAQTQRLNHEWEELRSKGAKAVRLCIFLKPALFFVFAYAVGTTSAFGQQLDVQDICGQPPLTGVEIETRGQLSVEAGAQRLFGARAGGDLDVVYRETINDIFSAYPDAHRTNLARAVLYQVCALIFTADDLSTIEKLEQYRQFEVVSNVMQERYDPSTINFLDTVVDEQVEVRLSGCTQRSTTLQCAMSITSQFEDLVMRISTSSRYSNAADTQGNVFLVEDVRIGNGGDRHLFVQGVAVPTIVEFSTGTISPHTLSRVRFLLYKNSGNSADVVFRNIPIN